MLCPLGGVAADQTRERGLCHPLTPHCQVPAASPPSQLLGRSSRPQLPGLVLPPVSLRAAPAVLLPCAGGQGLGVCGHGERAVCLQAEATGVQSRAFKPAAEKGLVWVYEGEGLRWTRCRHVSPHWS